ncbi:MAG: amidohydrolase family protein [Gemmatimonadota bacterium]
MSAIILDNARVVTPDGVVAKSLAFSDGVVGGAPRAGALRIDLHDHMILPGLINAHDHLHLNGIAPLEHLPPFANSYQWIDAWSQTLAEAPGALTAMTRHERYWQGGVKNILAGATTVAHHDPWHVALADPSFPAELLKEFGWCHSLGLGASSPGHRPRYGPAVLESFNATSASMPWIIHLAEGIDDIAAAELEQLEALGCLASNTVLVHGVGLSERDVDRVIGARAAVIWCPSSNRSMFGRTLDARRLFNAGRLALGTDSRLTGSRDLLEELRVAQACSDLTPAELFQLVTTDAARVLRAPRAGELTSRHRADCIILPASGNPCGALLGTTRSDIRAVVRAGVPAVADPDFADWFEHCGIPVVEASLDGRKKLIARKCLAHLRRDAEPGLSLP